MDTWVDRKAIREEAVLRIATYDVEEVIIGTQSLLLSFYGHDTQRLVCLTEDARIVGLLYIGESIWTRKGFHLLIGDRMSFRRLIDVGGWRLYDPERLGSLDRIDAEIAARFERLTMAVSTDGRDSLCDMMRHEAEDGRLQIRVALELLRIAES
ncbi:hypothetical protein Tco_0872793 [Tanacetum coccineum]